MSQSRIASYLSDNRERHLEELRQFLKLPSISSLSAHKDDVQRTASWVAEALEQAGLNQVRIMPTGGHPVVYGERMESKDKPTVLVYGHYDVQPVDPLHLWETPPFEPHIRDGKIYARGASDDKGQVFMHIKAVEAILNVDGELPVNIKFCLEGEEEIGSPNLDRFVEEHKQLLAADVLVVSDSPMLEKGKPTVCYGLRGLAGLQIDVRGAKGDLHSGLYGGGVQNPLHALARIVASMHDREGRVTVDGFYDKVLPLADEERAAYASLSFDEEGVRKELDVPELFGEKGYSFLERTWARPTLEVNGLYGGFQEEGIKTVLPREAHAKITCRLVPDQDPEEIVNLLNKHIEKHTLPGVTVTTTPFDKGRPFLTPFDHPAIQAAGKSLAKAYGTEPAFTRMGGSIPIVETFSQLLQLPVALIGFGLSTENFHAPNEHFHLENFDKGLLTLCYYGYDLKDALTG